MLLTHAPPAQTTARSSTTAPRRGNAGSAFDGLKLSIQQTVAIIRGVVATTTRHELPQREQITFAVIARIGDRSQSTGLWKRESPSKLAKQTPRLVQHHRLPCAPDGRCTAQARLSSKLCSHSTPTEVIARLALGRLLLVLRGEVK